MTNEPTEAQQKFLDKHNFEYDGFLGIYSCRYLKLNFVDTHLEKNKWHEVRKAIILLTFLKAEAMVIIEAAAHDTKS